MTKTKKLETTTAMTATATPTTAEIITAENVQTIAERIAIKALKTCLSSGQGKTPEQAQNDNGKNPNPSGNFGFLNSLYCGLVGDIVQRKNDIHAPLTDGYDIAQTACAYLCGYIGETLQDKTEDGQTDKQGNPVTILRGCFRAVNRYIMSERQHAYQRAYVDDIDEDGSTLYYEIPDEWDTLTLTDYRGVNDTVKALKLTSKQHQILRYRLCGNSLHKIADTLNINRKTLQGHMQAIQRKYTEYTATQFKGVEEFSEYDELGRVAHYHNSNGYNSWLEYDDKGYFAHIRDTNGVEEWYGYDKNGSELHYRNNSGIDMWLDEDGKQIEKS